MGYDEPLGVQVIETVGGAVRFGADTANAVIDVARNHGVDAAVEHGDAD